MTKRITVAPTYSPMYKDVKELDQRWFKWLNDVAMVLNGDGLLPPTGVTLGASPAVYRYVGPNSGSLIVSGGTVSLIEFSRGGVVYYTTGQIAGMFALSPTDYLRITYTVVPTVTLVLR